MKTESHLETHHCQFCEILFLEIDSQFFLQEKKAAYSL